MTRKVWGKRRNRIYTEEYMEMVEKNSILFFPPFSSQLNELIVTIVYRSYKASEIQLLIYYSLTIILVYFYTLT